MKKKLDLTKFRGKDRAFLGRITAKLISDLALQSLHDGDISIRGMTDNEIATEVATQLKSLIEKKRLKIVFHIDFSDRLLAEARKYFRQKKPELSALYYATYFEHCLNWLIVEICRKKKIDDDATRQLIREVNLRAKCAWVMTLLNNRSLKIGFVNSIIMISEIETHLFTTNGQRKHLIKSKNF